MSVPTLSLQVAFGHGPIDPTPVFTEIAGDLLSLGTTMGRQHQLDRIEPSTLTAVLDDRLGNYSPWDTSSPYYNLLTATDASLPTIGTWVASAGTVGIQSTQTLQGATAGRLTSTGGTATAHTATGTSGYAVTGSTQYSAGAYFRAATTGQNVEVGLNWYTSGGTLIGSTVFGTAVADVNTGWTQATVTATSPSNAAFAAVVVSAASSGTLVHYFDCVMFCLNPTNVPIGWTPGQTLPMVPGRPVRCVPVWSAVPYPVFYGFTDSWTPQPKDELNQDAQLQAFDILKQLNQKYLSNPTLYPNLAISLSPLAYWRFAETSGYQAFDASGNGATATYQGSPTYGVAGAQLYDPNTAVTLAPGPDGSWILAPEMPGQGGAGGFSFGVWFKTSDNSQQILTWASNAGTNPTAVWAAVDGNGNLALFDGEAQIPPWNVLGPPTEEIAGTVPVDDGLWHRVIVTMSAPSGGVSTWTLYQDGVSLGTWSGEYWSETDSQDLFIGGLFAVANAGTPTQGTFDGSVDEAQVWAGVLTPTQVANDFTVGSYFQNVEFTGQRIAKALIVAGFGSFPQNLATGTVLCQAEISTVTQSLCGDYILIANDTENGLLYQDTLGVLQFKDRHYPQLNSTSTTSQATIGDNPGATFHYEVEGLSIPQDTLDLWPDVKGQRNNGVLQEVTDFSHVPNGFSQTLQRTALLMNTDPDVLYLMQWLSYLYSSPQVRVGSVTLSSIMNGGANLPQMLGRALWDAVTIQRQGTGESPLSSLQAVESISHNFTSDDPSWKTTWQLSPFEVSAKANQVLIISSASQGILDTNVIGG